MDFTTCLAHFCLQAPACAVSFHLERYFCVVFLSKRYSPCLLITNALFFLFKIWLFLSMSLCVLGCVCRAHGGQKRGSDALELEGQRVRSYLTWMLRPESHLSRMTHVALRSSFLSSPCVHMFIQALCIVYSGHSSFRTNSAVSYFLVWPNGLRRTCTLWVHELDHNSFPAGDTLIITGTQIRFGKVSLHTHRVPLIIL